MGFITLNINCNPKFGNFQWLSSCPSALVFLCFGSFCVSPISPSSSPFDSRPLLLSERSNKFELFRLLDPCTPFLKSRTGICVSRRLSCLVLSCQILHRFLKSRRATFLLFAVLIVLSPLQVCDEFTDQKYSCTATALQSQTDKRHFHWIHFMSLVQVKSDNFEIF